MMTPRQDLLNTLALANADYEDRKASGNKVPVSVIEKEWGLKPRQLRNFRANLSAGRTTEIDLEY